ncbi:Amino acid dehydrogenase family protein [Raphanus sativus]|nr:Amino acid dehydrogenase family protein [Raphanus sativus]
MEYITSLYMAGTETPACCNTNLGEEIDLEIEPGDDEAAFATNSLIGGPPREPSAGEHDETKHMVLVSDLPSEDQDMSKGQPASAKRKKKVVKRWREEWADTYKWAYVDMKDGTARIFCSVCREYGRKHRRNPYGNEGSRNMQMSALEEHNNSLLHKEALRLQTSSKDKIVVDKPIYVKSVLCTTYACRYEQEIKGRRCVVSGSGKIAMHVVEKLIACGAHPVTVSDSKGYLVDEDGFD